MKATKDEKKMNYFSKNTLKHAQTLFRIKDELKVTLDQNGFDEVDLYNFADELIKSLQPEKQKDHFRDPGIKRDYRNYALDKAFEKHQDEIFLREESIYDFENDYETHDVILKNFINSIHNTGVAAYA